MAKISVTARLFRRGVIVNPSPTLDVSLLDFMLASITVGFQRFGGSSLVRSNFIMHRLGLGLSGSSYLANDAGNLRRVDGYEILDASEKGAMSFWQGMVFAKLVADQKLGVRWLVHVDDMIRKKVLKNVSGTKERADLAGMDSAGEWHVIEAKGRSNRLEKGLIAKAKQQARNVRTIDGKRPKTRSACVSCVWTYPIDVILEDPPSKKNEEDSEEWQFTEAEYLTYYYQNIAHYIENNENETVRLGGLEYCMAPLPPYLFGGENILPSAVARPNPPTPKIGLPVKIMAAPERARQILTNTEAFISDYASSDGVALTGVENSWEESNA